MRTFISLNPDEIIRKRISEIQKELIFYMSSISKKFPGSVMWESEDKFHVTLFFIGDVNEDKLEKIHSGLRKTESTLSPGKISISAKGINAFPDLKHPRVLILELNDVDKKIFGLNLQIKSIMSELKENIAADKPFHPHITLGRVRRNHRINLTRIIDKLELDKIKTDLNFSFEKFHLMESKLSSSGSEYSVIKDYKM